MAKIVSIKNAGIEPVYNMTVDVHHNYLIAGGAILKNCDALRYFCAYRAMGAMKDEAVERYDDDDGRVTEHYEDAMCGGAVTQSYMHY